MITLMWRIARVAALLALGSCSSSAGVPSPGASNTCQSDPSVHSLYTKSPVSGEGSFGRLAIDATHVYWTESEGFLRRTTRDGCGAPETVANSVAPADNALLDADNVYWTSNGAVLKMSKKALGEPVVLARENGPIYVAMAIDSEAIYYTPEGVYSTANGYAPMPLMRVPIAGGPAVALTDPAHIRAIAVDSQFVYWAADGKLSRMPKGGGPIETLASGQVDPCGIALRDGAIYWSNGGTSGTDNLNFDGAVMALAPGASQPTVLASKTAHCAIAVTADNLYVATHAAPFYNARPVMAVPRHGGAPSDVSASGAEGGLAADDNGVFWAIRRAKDEAIETASR